MISVLTFLSGLLWIDGAPIRLELYREDLFRRALDERRPDGSPRYNMVLSGRAKKNFKTSDMVLAALFCLLCRESPQGSDVLIVANDEDQAGDDLDLAKKLVAINGLGDSADGELEVLEKEIRRRDGRGTMSIIPARNATGQHGKSACFIGYDEIHGQRDWALMEALQPDPTRECLQWITSYDTIYDTEGVPLHDLKQIGIAGTDQRMLFSWYSAELCTDPNFASLPPEERANPSMASWPEGKDYLYQQRRRLPSAKYRRLHLNLPGAPQGAFFDQGIVERAIVPGRQEIPPQDGTDYVAFVDMSGGSNDDATLGIAHWDGHRAVLDVLMNQGDAVPFNPRLAVARFALICKRYRCSEVHGDAYAGQTFRMDFADCGIDYIVDNHSRTDLYEGLEVALNANQIELLDLPILRSELMTIVRRGASLDHMSGRHDDWATSAAGALTLVNPDLGNAEPAILIFMQRQIGAEISVACATPTLHHEHGREGFLQPIRPHRPSDYVMVQVPTDVSHIQAISGHSFATELAEGGRVVWMPPDDARNLISSPLNFAFFGANADLRSRIGSKPAPPRGIRWTDVVQAAEDARTVHMSNKGGITNQTFAMLRRTR